MASQKSPLFLLPDELIGKIYSYISDAVGVRSLLSLTRKSQAIAQEYCCSKASHVSVTEQVDQEPEGVSGPLPRLSVAVDGFESGFSSLHRLLRWLAYLLKAAPNVRKLSLYLQFSDTPHVEANLMASLLRCCVPRASVESLRLHIRGGRSQEKISFLCTSFFQKYPNISSLSFSPVTEARWRTVGGHLSSLAEVLSGVPNLKRVRIGMSSNQNAAILDFQKGSVSLEGPGSEFSDSLFRDLARFNFLGQQAANDPQVATRNHIFILGESNMKEITTISSSSVLVTDGSIFGALKVWELRRYVRPALDSFFAVSGDRDQVLTYNVEMRPMLHSGNGTEVCESAFVRESVEAYNNDKRGGVETVAAGLGVDGWEFMSPISVEGVGEEELVVENFWKVWKGQRRAIVNLRLRFGEQ